MPISVATSMNSNEVMRIRSFPDIVMARSAGRHLAGRLGFGTADQVRLATAISELTRNVIQYAGSGSCEISDESDDKVSRIRVIVEDHGPGIANIEQALQDGFSTGGGLGAGLPGTKRLMNVFQISSKPGHTRVLIEMARPKRRL